MAWGNERIYGDIINNKLYLIDYKTGEVIDGSPVTDIDNNFIERKTKILEDNLAALEAETK